MYSQAVHEWPAQTSWYDSFDSQWFAKPESMQPGLSKFSHSTSPSSPEVKVLTSSRARRREQNRASQKAFHQRQRKQLQTMQAEIEQLSSALASLQCDNRGLKEKIAGLCRQNRTLRASKDLASASHPSVLAAKSVPSLAQKPLTRLHGSMEEHKTCSASKRQAEQPVTPESCDDTVLDFQAAGLVNITGAWQVVQADAGFSSRALDSGAVFNRLRGVVRWVGKAPMFAEDDVLKVLGELRGAADV